MYKPPNAKKKNVKRCSLYLPKRENQWDGKQQLVYFMRKRF